MLQGWFHIYCVHSFNAPSLVPILIFRETCWVQKRWNETGVSSLWELNGHITATNELLAQHLSALLDPDFLVPPSVRGYQVSDSTSDFLVQPVTPPTAWALHLCSHWLVQRWVCGLIQGDATWRVLLGLLRNKLSLPLRWSWTWDYVSLNLLAAILPSHEVRKWS